MCEGGAPGKRERERDAGRGPRLGEEERAFPSVNLPSRACQAHAARPQAAVGWAAPAGVSLSGVWGRVSRPRPNPPLPFLPPRTHKLEAERDDEEEREDGGQEQGGRLQDGQAAAAAAAAAAGHDIWRRVGEGKRDVGARPPRARKASFQPPLFSLSLTLLSPPAPSFASFPQPSSHTLDHEDHPRRPRPGRRGCGCPGTHGIGEQESGTHAEAGDTPPPPPQRHTHTPVPPACTSTLRLGLWWRWA